MTAPDVVTSAKMVLHYAAGLDLRTDHGKDTPTRFLAMLNELTGCKDCNGDCIKWKTFPATSDQMIVIRDIPFVSVCNHHVLPFHGKAHIGYIPDGPPADPYDSTNLRLDANGIVWGKIAGLSKFARVVNHFARRLQVQEELGAQIADFLSQELHPVGVAVVLKAEHTCMTIRGVQAPGTYTTTSIMRGAFADHKRTAKAEFMQHLNGVHT